MRFTMSLRTEAPLSLRAQRGNPNASPCHCDPFLSLRPLFRHTRLSVTPAFIGHSRPHSVIPAFLCHSRAGGNPRESRGISLRWGSLRYIGAAIFLPPLLEERGTGGEVTNKP